MNKQSKKKEKQEAAEGLHIESDAESDTGLMSAEPATEIPKQNAGMELAMQLASADTSAIPMATGLQTPMDVQGEEEAMETEVALDLNVPTAE